MAVREKLLKPKTGPTLRTSDGFEQTLRGEFAMLLFIKGRQVEVQVYQESLMGDFGVGCVEPVIGRFEMKGSNFNFQKQLDRLFAAKPDARARYDWGWCYCVIGLARNDGMDNFVPMMGTLRPMEVLTGSVVLSVDEVMERQTKMTAHAVEEAKTSKWNDAL